MIDKLEKLLTERRISLITDGFWNGLGQMAAWLLILLVIVPFGSIVLSGHFFSWLWDNF